MTLLKTPLKRKIKLLNVYICDYFFSKCTYRRKWLWKAPTVQLLNVNQLHLIKCTEDDLTGLLHSHSIYTVSSGNVKIDYNLDGLEKDLVQRFVHGKHIITHTLEIPQVRWQTQTYNSQTITSVKMNIPQVS